MPDPAPCHLLTVNTFSMVALMSTCLDPGYSKRLALLHTHFLWLMPELIQWPGADVRIVKRNKGITPSSSAGDNPTPGDEKLARSSKIK